MRYRKHTIARLGHSPEKSMYENEDVIQLTEADAKLPTTEAEAQDRHNRIVRHAQQLHAEVEAGKKTLAEKDRRIEQMAVDLKALQQSLSIIGSRDPMESAGASDVELRRFVDNDGKLFLRGYESNDPAQRRSDDTGLLTTQPVNDAHRNLIEATEALYVTAVVKHGRDAFNHTGTAYREGVVKGLGTAYHRVQRAWSAMPKFVKRAWDDQNGSGGEFIPTPLLASPMWQVGEYDPEGLLSLFPRTQISTESVEMPVGTLYPVPYKGGGATGDNPAALAKSTVGTDKITLTANPMYVMVFVHEDAAADSIVAAFPFIRSSIARGSPSSTATPPPATRTILPTGISGACSAPSTPAASTTAGRSLVCVPTLSIPPTVSTAPRTASPPWSPTSTSWAAPVACLPTCRSSRAGKAT
jgi:hypothetical protein